MTRQDLGKELCMTVTKMELGRLSGQYRNDEAQIRENYSRKTKSAAAGSGRVVGSLV